MFGAIGSIRKDKIPEGTKVETLYPAGIAVRSNDALIAQGKDTSKLHLIVEMGRIGAGLFNVKMEYTHFPPRSGKNNLFEMLLMQWPDPKSFLWAISSFPIEYRPQAESIARECGLRLADGIPTIFNQDGAHQFPLEGPTVFTLENIKGHQVYGNDAKAHDKLKSEERLAIDAIVGADRTKLVSEMTHKGYSGDQIKRIFSRWEFDGNEEYDEAPAITKDGQHRHKSPL